MFGLKQHFVDGWKYKTGEFFEKQFTEFPVSIILKMYGYIWAPKKPFIGEAHWTCLNRMTSEPVTSLTAAGLRIHIGKPHLTDSEV